MIDTKAIQDADAALRILKVEQREGESLEATATRIVHEKNRGLIPDGKPGGHTWVSVGSIDPRTGNEPVKCTSCLVVSHRNRDITHAQPFHEGVYFCHPAHKDARTARLIIELEGRRGQATVAMIPVDHPSMHEAHTWFGMDGELEWCQIFGSKIAFNNTVRIAIADMLTRGRKR